MGWLMAVYSHGYALIVGVGADLPKTIDDAQALADIIRDPQRCAYPPKQVRLITGKAADRQGILDGLDWLKSQTEANPEASAIVYFSGHGGLFNHYYLIPYGCDPYALDRTAISGNEFTEKLESLKAKKLVVLLDCCHAGGITRIKAFQKEAIPPEFSSIFNSGQGRIAIASSHKNEYSYVGEQLSFFTVALIEALQGHGVSDEDGYVWISDLILWIARRVPELSQQKQHPDLSFAKLDNFAISYYAAGGKKRIEPILRPSQEDSASTGDKPDKPADFAIITALPEELYALLRKLRGYRRLPPTSDDIHTYFQADIPIQLSNKSRGSYRIILMCLPGMGRVQAASATSDIIRRWHPRYVLLVGIAGGIADGKTCVGDILIVDQVVDYELQKVTPQGPQVRWEVHRAHPRLIEACNNFGDESWQKLIEVDRPQPGLSKRLKGPIASGDKVIAYSEVLSVYSKMWPKLIGVEMEAGGAAAAAFLSAEQPGFFMVRGVSDLADENKNTTNVEAWRSYACDAAASFAIAFLKSGPVPLTEELGKSK